MYPKENQDLIVQDAVISQKSAKNLGYWIKNKSNNGFNIDTQMHNASIIGQYEQITSPEYSNYTPAK